MGNWRESDSCIIGKLAFPMAASHQPKHRPLGKCHGMECVRPSSIQAFLGRGMGFEPLRRGGLAAKNMVGGPAGQRWEVIDTSPSTT